MRFTTLVAVFFFCPLVGQIVLWAVVWTPLLYEMNNIKIVQSNPLQQKQQRNGTGEILYQRNYREMMWGNTLQEED